VEAPRHGSFIERRVLDRQVTALDKSLHSEADTRLHALEERLEKSPGDTSAVSHMGEWCLVDRQHLRAQALLQRAVDNSKSAGGAGSSSGPDVCSLNNLGVVQAKLGFWSSALEPLQAAARVSPGESAVWSNIAAVSLAASRYDGVLEAAQKLQESVSGEDGSEEARAEWAEEIATLRGLAFAGKKQWPEARAALGAALHMVRAHHNGKPEEGEEADALNNLALAEAGAGEFGTAIEHLRAALHAAPGHPRVLNNLGVLALEQGRADVAHKYLSLAAQIEEELESPEPARIANMGVALAARGALDEALESFQKAGAFESAEFEVQYNLGRALIEWGLADKGVEALRKAFALDPYNADVHTVLGTAYLFKGQEKLLPEAVKHFKRALQLNPQHKVALLNMTLALRESHHEETAAKLLSQTLKQFPTSAPALFLGALMTMERGGEPAFAAAGGQLASVWQARPDALVALYNGALCQFLIGMRDDASNQWGIVAQRDPTFVPAHYMVGMGHAAASRFDKAIAAWAHAVEYEPGSIDLQANMGFAYYRLGKWNNAVKSFMSAHGLDPSDADLLAALGISFARAQMYPQALTAFTQSTNLNPRNAVTHSNIGLAYYLQNKVEDAIVHWKIVSQLDRSYAEKREEEQYKSFDDTQITLRPFRWRERVVWAAPSLPPPRLRLLPGFNSRRLRPLFCDESARKAWAKHEEADKARRKTAHLLAK
jgi:tetratricopeptide (TPR) repeat protein